MVVPTAPLFINRDADLDWLIALEYGRVCDGHPSEQFRPVGERFAWMLDCPSGRRIVGFCVGALRDFDPEAHRALWRGPRFDAPLFGLTRATAGEIILATRAALLDEPTTNRCYFADAETLNQLKANNQILWQYCTAQGDVSEGANPNGALWNIAGICNPSRNVAGLMPHPERACEAILGSADGCLIFQSLIHALDSRKTAKAA